MTNPTPIRRRAEWLAALRSGTFPKGRNHLEINGTFCCLGVYCRVLGIEHKRAEDFETDYFQSDWVPSEGTVLYRVPTEHGNDELAWCDDTEPTELGGLTPKQISELVKLNDLSEDFDPVIAYIEANTEGASEP